MRLVVWNLHVLALLLDHVSSSVNRKQANDLSHIHQYHDTLCRAAHLGCDNCDESGYAIRAALSYLNYQSHCALRLLPGVSQRTSSILRLHNSHAID